MPQLGPQYDLASRLSALEDLVRRMASNQLGQAFSVTQSDGSVGLQIGQYQGGSGATAMQMYQGPTTARDANTGLHPTLAYFGELFAGGVSVDSGVAFYRPSGHQSAVVGNRGVQILDPAGHQVLGTDEYGASPSNIGLNSPWLPLGQPVTNTPSNTGWPNTTSTSSALVAFLTFPAQHSHITWYGTTYLASGAGSVQITVNNGAAGAVQAVGAGFTNLNETFSLGTWSWQQALQLGVNAQVTSGAGPLYVQVFGVWGCGSGF